MYESTHPGGSTNILGLVRGSRLETMRESWRRHSVTVDPPRGCGVYSSDIKTQIDPDIFLFYVDIFEKLFFLS